MNQNESEWIRMNQNEWIELQSEWVNYIFNQVQT